MEYSQINRSLIATLCRKVNCFVEPAAALAVPCSGELLLEAWETWVEQEKMRRLAYTAWVRPGKATNQKFSNQNPGID